MAQALGEGVLWNTSVIVVKVKMLWGLGTKVLPSMMRLLETLSAGDRVIPRISGAGRTVCKDAGPEFLL